MLRCPEINGSRKQLLISSLKNIEKRPLTRTYELRRGTL